MVCRKKTRSRKKSLRAPRHPEVLLIVETSLISGREILRGISQYAREHGPWSICHEPRGLEAPSTGAVKNWRGDGIIARLQDPRLAGAVVKTGLPAVDVLGVTPRDEVPLVHVDNTRIGRLAAEHLLQCGLKHFGYCGIRKWNWSQARQAAFTQTLAEAGFDCKIYYLPSHNPTESSWENQQQRLAKWISGLPKPAGVMCCYDPHGQKVLEACRRAGVLVPEQVAFVGVDDDQTVCEACNPPLSSVATNHARVGYEAAALLDRLMRGEAAPNGPIYVEPVGVVSRQSTDVLTIDDTDVTMALRYIQQYACKGVQVKDVVDTVSLSYGALSSRFQKIVGHSIHDEILWTRIKHAQELLAGTQDPIQKIASSAGFKHQEYMGVVFKNKLGKTPGQYRKEFHALHKHAEVGTFHKHY